jgi:hypothetical protein
MAKCPSCGKDVAVFKEWDYGPIHRDGPKMHVKLYHCKCGEKFREWISKSTGKITTTRITKARKPTKK